MRYYFDLNSAGVSVSDPYGTDLHDEQEAQAHAKTVAHELMFRREVKTRSWRLTVCDDHRHPLFTLLFARADQTLSHLNPELRSSVELVCEKSASLTDAILQVQSSLQEAKATIGHSNRTLQLVASNGVRI